MGKKGSCADVYLALDVALLLMSKKVMIVRVE